LKECCPTLFFLERATFVRKKTLLIAECYFASQIDPRRRTQMKFASLLFCLLTAISLSAQTFSTVATFDGSDGYGPQGPLVQGFDGSLYGVANSGGGSIDCQMPGCGTVFKMSAEGTLTLVHSFNGVHGSFPSAGLVLATDGDLFGTTAGGQKTTSSGSVFAVTPPGTLFTLAGFTGANGAVPYGPVVLATNGNFYGTTNRGYQVGTIFEITPTGVLTTLHRFQGTDGSYPYAGLVLANDGNLYGTTTQGGAHSGGTVFKITPGGTFSTIYNFCAKTNCADGSGPYGTLVQATDGYLYGTTTYGGANTTGCNGNSCGTVFKISLNGALTTLHSFCSEAGCADGSQPDVGLLQATDGKFYATAHSGGAHGYGTIFQITSAGVLTTLHDFDTPDGVYPALMQATNGTLYGATRLGGTSSNCPGGAGCGTVFSLSMELKPFVQTVPTARNIGQKVIILGSDLTGATSVTFNGKASTFSVVSPTEITATVPSGATTGTLEVVTPSGILKSNVPFRIL
jgi:uncharacterized repeat protein (TIGR03803 family)